MILLNIPEPKNCDGCLFCDAERGFCYLSTTDGTLKTTKNVTKYADHYTKPDWCPGSKKFEEDYGLLKELSVDESNIKEEENK